MREYKPDSFMLFKHKIGDEVVTRMICGWSGGYLEGDTWRLSSPFVAVNRQEKYFQTEGGGKYYYIGAERISMSFSGIYTEAQQTEGFQDVSLDQVLLDMEGV